MQHDDERAALIAERRKRLETLQRDELRQMPKYLYKYRAGTDDDLNALTRRKVWFPSFKKLVDEYDGKLRPRIELAVRWRDSFVLPVYGPHGEVVTIPVRLAGELSDTPATPEQLAEIQNYVDELMDWAAEIGCYSLCADGRSHRMWKEYGNDFAGYCIEFDWRMDPDTVDLSDGRTFAIDTTYFDELPKYDYAVLRLENRSMLFNRLFRPKLRKYEFEKEWRIIEPKGGRLSSEPAPISAIMFGDKTSDEVKQQIKHIFREHPSVAFRRAQPAAGETVKIASDQ